ncbi:MAG: hypothetical protein AUI15_27805 [Actinobacteria bacterium 13_2_20CM_2_66_6]|nr:MAG: hypothetical protein AUI15_27805 [Actinobacteria bacterium 13_2_20CM_2_66_6]
MLPWELGGDQATASAGLLGALAAGDRHVTLRGVTGSGKTVTMAKVIAEAGRPALILAHNKTLAAQLYGEFKEFFPENAVQYFVSYYDYYQPEAYIARSDTYIEKDSSRNEEIDKMRHAATRSLFERRDVIIVASVSCIYGLGAPVDYGAVTVRLNKGERVRRDTVLRHLVDIQYERTNADLVRGKFRVRGDTLEVQPAYEDLAVRVEFFGDDVERITELDPLTGEVLAERDKIDIYPARHFVTPREKLLEAIKDIEVELVDRVAELENAGRLLEAQRLRQRTNFDLEMLRETGTCARCAACTTATARGRRSSSNGGSVSRARSTTGPSPSRSSSSASIRGSTSRPRRARTSSSARRGSSSRSSARQASSTRRSRCARPRVRSTTCSPRSICVSSGSSARSSRR